MNDLIEELVLHAAAYFATIHAGREPDPVDPFLAKLMAHAIRDKAGIVIAAPPVNGVNGVSKLVGERAGPDGLGAPARAVFNVVRKHAGPDGVTPDQVAKWMDLPKQNVQYHLIALTKRGLLGRVGTGRYYVTYYVTWDGATKPRVDVGSAPPGSMRGELQRRGLSHPGQLNIKVAEYAKAAGRDVASREIGQLLKAKTTSTTAKAMGPLLKIGALTKVSIGVYRWVDG